MNTLERKYLTENNFHLVSDKNGEKVYETSVIEEGELSCRNTVSGKVRGFNDGEQISILLAKFHPIMHGGMLWSMSLSVSSVLSGEFDVTLSWSNREGKMFASSIGGEDLYELVSQAIVLSDTSGLDRG